MIWHRKHRLLERVFRHENSLHITQKVWWARLLVGGNDAVTEGRHYGQLKD